LRNQMDTATGWYWESDPAKDVVQVFKSYVLGGFQCDHIEIALDEEFSSNDSVKPPASLLKKIKRFYASVAPAESGQAGIQLFGGFRFGRYMHVNIGKPLLFTIPYGTSGSAEVFFDLAADGQVKFWTSSVLTDT